jgi:hypothetical protein
LLDPGGDPVRRQKFLSDLFVIFWWQLGLFDHIFAKMTISDKPVPSGGLLKMFKFLFFFSTFLKI